MLNRNNTIVITLFFITIILASSALFSGSKTREITLSECIKIALENHPDQLVAEQDMRYSRANYQVKKGERSLKIDGVLKTREIAKDSTTSLVSIPGVDTDIALFSGLYAKYNLYDPKKKWDEQAAEIQVSAGKMQMQKTTDEVIYNLKEAYFEYLYSGNEVALKAELLDKSREKLALSKKLYENGLRPVLDLSKAEMNVAEAMLEYEKARNNARLKRAGLYMAMGLVEKDAPGIEPVDPDGLPCVKYNEDELTKLALLYNPDIQTSSLDTRVKRIQVEAARSLHKPSVSIELGLGLENRKVAGINNSGNISDNLNTNNWEPTFFGNLVAGLPLYYGGAISAKVEAAIAEYNKSLYREREIHNKIKTQVQVLIKDLEELRKQYDMSNMVIENSSKHVFLARKSYENGEGSLLDLNDAEAGVIRSKLTSYSVKYKYLMTLATISKLIGVKEELLCQY